MRILNSCVKNFASYKELTFNFNDKGLALVSGVTGAGKSTLMDVATWIIFGMTSKNGNVNDVLSWTSNESTQGSIQIEFSDGIVCINRVRGQVSENDLWFSFKDGDKIRGKNLKETQDLIEEVLGFTYEQYATASLFNEFSTTGNFFTSSLQQRREVFEKIANLSLPIKIMKGSKNGKKETAGVIREREKVLANLSGRLEQLRDYGRNVKQLSERWHTSRETDIINLEKSAISFDQEQRETLEQIEILKENFEHKRANISKDLSGEILSLYQWLESKKEVCDACGQPNKEVISIQKKMDQVQVELEKNASQINPYLSEIKKIKLNKNTFQEESNKKRQEKDPYLSQIDSIYCDIQNVKHEHITLENQILNLKSKLSDLETLFTLSFELRGELITRSVKEIEAKTNEYLSKYFDNEIKIELIVESGDSLDVLIQKSGHFCSYSQLSRGQRSMLKLCFAVSVMRAAANEMGIHFEQLFFDEVLDGLSIDLKLKAVGLFQELQLDHESIFVIDHATEIQNEFATRFHVTLESDESRIIKE